MVAKPQWSGAGIVQGFFSPKAGSELMQETLDEWFKEISVPSIVKENVVTLASTWKAANPAYPKQNMILYEMPDLAPMRERLENYPTRADGNLETEFRILALEQYYETEKHPKDATTTIIYAAMQPGPGGEADLDRWYREEHNEQMSKEPAWKRTIRYRLLFQTRNDGKEPQGYDFLASHEFGEGNQLGKDVQPLQPMTDWTKKAMSECKAIDAAIYHKVDPSLEILVQASRSHANFPQMASFTPSPN
ncbi:hypothetical protein DM02DRAFT_602184 [Periconia macrospinosa]|uniref:Uncharacterized protein n=1 Tax=Periconia macrospinosa TaxID=97972 RepID=A0A2V1D922_9PLEO|nr:hypothetical protein DM02DRAFT_602184 [Periconia macrospinosa]